MDMEGNVPRNLAPVLIECVAFGARIRRETSNDTGKNQFIKSHGQVEHANSHNRR